MESTPAAPDTYGASLAGLSLSPRAKLEILGAVLVGLLLGALDQTIVSVALPTIVSELGGQSLLTWTITIYLLTSTITVPFYGKLSDLYGRKPLLMLGIGLFLLGSVLSGFSQDIYQLIAFRGVQGLGAGALFPISLAVIGDLYTPAERGKYQGLFGAVFGLSSIVGPLLGGWLTESVSWHWIFFVNLPVGAIALFVIWRLLPTIKRPDASRNLDIAGAAVFTVAVATFLIGLTNKQTSDWATPEVGGLISIGLLLGAVFVWIESRAKEPIVPLDLWRNRTYATSIASTFLISFGFFGAAVFLPQWFQFVKGVSPTESGLQTLPLLAGLIVSSIGAGQIVSRTGRYKALIVGSTALMAVGLLLMTGIRPDTPLPLMWLWMFITGAGIGPTLSVFTIVVQNAVPFAKLGVATSNLTFFRQVGGSIGLAVLGTVFGTRFAQELVPQARAAGVPEPLVEAFAATAGSGDAAGFIEVGGDQGAAILAQVPAQFQDQVRPFIDAILTGLHQAYSLAISEVFLIGVGATVVAGVVAVGMRELALRTAHGPGPTSAPAAAPADRPAADRRPEPAPIPRPAAD